MTLSVGTPGYTNKQTNNKETKQEHENLEKSEARRGNSVHVSESERKNSRRFFCEASHSLMELKFGVCRVRGTAERKASSALCSCSRTSTGVLPRVGTGEKSAE